MLSTGTGSLVLGLVVCLLLSYLFFSAWNPLGWAILIASIIGIVKSVIQFFDKDYKKTQQRQAIDDFNNQAYKHIKEDFMNKLKDNFKKIREKFKLEIQKIDELPETIDTIYNISDKIEAKSKEMQKRIHL